MTNPSTELSERLTEQIRYLHASARLYDESDAAEAKRLATVIRTLVCDPKHMKSLLGQMRLLAKLDFEVTRPLDPANVLPDASLISLATGPGENGELIALWIPAMDVPWPWSFPPKPFAEWWTEPVVKDGDDNYFTRENLVRHAGDKDGGHHVDPRLPTDYWQLSRANALGWTIHDSRGDTPMFSNPVLPAIRQIAHEVLVTFKRHEAALSALGVSVLEPPLRTFKPPTQAA